MRGTRRPTESQRGAIAGALGVEATALPSSALDPEAIAALSHPRFKARVRQRAQALGTDEVDVREGLAVAARTRRGQEMRWVDVFETLLAEGRAPVPDFSRWRRARNLARELVSDLPDRNAFATDPAAAVNAVGIAIVDVADVPAACSIDGTYRRIPAPEIRWSPVFQLLGEPSHCFTSFGHHLIYDHLDAARALLRDPDQGRVLEEAVCDAVAALLLLPEQETLVESERGPTAAEVIGWHRASRASREACCVRAVELMRTEGYAMLGLGDGTAIFTAQTGTPYRVARGTEQGEDFAVGARGDP